MKYPMLSSLTSIISPLKDPKQENWRWILGLKSLNHYESLLQTTHLSQMQIPDIEYMTDRWILFT